MKNCDTHIFPDILDIQDVEFDGHAFWPLGEPNQPTRWDDIIEVCRGYWIHDIAIVDFYFHGFRTNDDTHSVWVETGNKAFDAEIQRRFPHAESPDFVEYNDKAKCVQTFTLWPVHRYGMPMYSTVKEHWYSSPKLAFPQNHQKL